MKTTKILTVSFLVATLTASAALAGPRGSGGGGRRGNVSRTQAVGVCPAGNAPGTCVGKSVRTQGNPRSTGTPLRDGSGKVAAPGNGAKYGTGNNPRHRASTPAG